MVWISHWVEYPFNSKVQAAICLLQKLTTFLLCILKLKWLILWIVEYLMQWRSTVDLRFHSSVNFFWCHHRVTWRLWHRHYRAAEGLKCHVWNINPKWHNGGCVTVSNLYKTQDRRLLCHWDTRHSDRKIDMSLRQIDTMTGRILCHRNTRHSARKIDMSLRQFDKRNQTADMSVQCVESK